MLNSYNTALKFKLNQRFAVIILAAGQSRRLGQPKQLLTKNGHSLLAYHIDLALDVQPERIIVIINEDLHYLSQSFTRADVEFYINQQAHLGLSSSLQIAATQLKDYSQPILIVGIDQPLLDIKYLSELMQQSAQHPQHTIASYYANTIGIPMIIQPELLAQSGQLSGNRGLKQLITSQSLPVIMIEALQLAFDIDTPQDLITARHCGWID